MIKDDQVVSGVIPKVTLGHYSLKIHFGTTLHLRIPRPDLAGIQSWSDDDSYFVIMFHLRDGTTIETEYDRRDKWEAILRGLDKELE